MVLASMVVLCGMLHVPCTTDDYAAKQQEFYVCNSTSMTQVTCQTIHCPGDNECDDIEWTEGQDE